ncbi:MAG: type IV-A pilus assembly ATPase PilB [Deltaproteobacteria bacterium]|nr:MAG: type IV-A pilus assembly ATPase PilB [Deltaproteobacteria bacterium]
MASSVGLGELLVRDKLITPAELQKAEQDRRESGERLGYTLTKLGYIKDTDLTQFLSRTYGVPSINLDDFEIAKEILDLVPRDVAERHLCVPVNRAGNSLIVAMADPTNLSATDDLRFLTGYAIEVVVASEVAIREAIQRYYEERVDMAEILSDYDLDEVDVSEGDGGAIDLTDLAKSAEDAPVVRLVNLVLIDAIKKNCSDIHIEPYETEFRVRYRIDGVLYEVMKPPLKLKNALTSRLKIMARLDIAERRLPQDGRIKLKLGKGQEMDYRVSVLPTLFGEKVVLRLLDKSNLQLDMTKLGFESEPLTHFKTAIHLPYGMVLVTGPTGSGKTTTLYSALSELNKVSENISTAEDPVEFNLKGINQCQMNDSVGLNFAAALRSFLRQDPDIIMVGEIRDFETAEIAVKAALTGHMVLSTLHTNDAPSTISRMLNMGIEPFLVTASVNLVVAQRLARRLCAECKGPIEVDPQVLLDLQVAPELAKSAKILGPKGCGKCNNTGYKGRVALYEVMRMGDALKEAVLQGYSSVELKREAIRDGMKTLRQAGITKLLEGVTSVAEVVRCTAPD